MKTAAVMQTSAEFETPLIEVIAKRRSRRAYSSRPIEPGKVRALFEAARWAPSSMNDQPWMYVYAIKGQSELWEKLFDLLHPGNKVWTKDAPLLVLSLTRRNFTLNGKPNGSARYDLGGANAFLSLQATDLGLNIHQMGGYDHDRAIRDLNIPDIYDLGVMMAIGYPGDPGLLPENLQQRERAQRNRYLQEEFTRDKAF